jgi:hypothetical protein
MRRLVETLVLLATIIVATISLIHALDSKTQDSAGWWQVFLAALALPILFYQLDQIRQAVTRRAKFKVGVASVRELPISRIRSMDALQSISVSQGYPHFFLVVQNIGKTVVQSVKVHFEYTRLPDSRSFPPVVVEAYEWLDDTRHSFKKENNVDFVFRGGPDWRVYPGDSEIFSFYITTAVVKQTEPVEVREPPAIGNYHFRCSVWAEGLTSPLVNELVIGVVESLHPDDEGNT